MPRAEYDEAKSRSNLLKHGIDFADALQLWTDPRHLLIPARTEGEERFMVIGCIDGVHWAGIVTYRVGVVRIISVRRARPNEVAQYENF